MGLKIKTILVLGLIAGCGLRTSGGRLLDSDASEAVQLIDSAVDRVLSDLRRANYLEESTAPVWREAMIRKIDSGGTLSSHIDEWGVASQVYGALLQQAQLPGLKDEGGFALLGEQSAVSLLAWYDEKSSKTEIQMTANSRQDLIVQFNSLASNFNLTLRRIDDQNSALSH